MANKLTKLAIWMISCALLPSFMGSCSKDDDDDPAPQNTTNSNTTNNNSNQSSPIVGTWRYSYNEGSYFHNCTLSFNNDNTGSIYDVMGTRASISQQMNFNWSLTTTSSGYYRLTVIYTSGDRDMNGGPFQGGYAQYSTFVTIAGNTLSIDMDDDTVMLFHR